VIDDELDLLLDGVLVDGYRDAARAWVAMTAQ